MAKREAQQTHETQKKSVSVSEVRALNGPQTTELNGWLLKLRAPVFFAVFFLCLWKWIDVGLIYHCGGVVRGFPAFFWGWDFARDLLKYPGGAVEYVSALAGQSLYYSWLGALVLTAQTWLIVSSFSKYLKGVGAGRMAVLAFLASILILTIYCRYQHASAPLSELAVAGVAICLNERVRQRRKWLRYGLILVTLALLYVTSPPGLAVYVLAISVREMSEGTNRPTILIALLGLVITPYIAGVWLFGLGIFEAYEKLLPFPWEAKLLNTDTVTLGVLYLMLPVLGAVVVLWQARAKRWIIHCLTPARSTKTAARASKSESKSATAASDAQDAKGGKSETRNAGRARYWQELFETGCLLALMLAVIKLTHHAELKSILASDAYAWQNRWPKALAATGPKPGNLLLAATKAQALFHLGRLTQELPQLGTADELLLAKEGPLAYWRKSDIYYDLGYVNMALHLLIESVEFWGERPALLERLALLNVALGNIETARIYLKALLKVPFHVQWARDHLRRMEVEPLLEHDPEVGRLRAQMIKADSVVRFSAEEELLSCLGANPGNRMAFEYLMTHYLLTRNLAGFINNLSRAREFPGFELSTLWKEALVVGASQLRQPLDLKGYSLDADAQRRFQQMLQVINACGGDKVVAQGKLKDEYANSYFYYYLFGR